MKIFMQEVRRSQDIQISLPLIDILDQDAKALSAMVNLKHMHRFDNKAIREQAKIFIESIGKPQYYPSIDEENILP